MIARPYKDQWNTKANLLCQFQVYKAVLRNVGENQKNSSIVVSLINSN